MPSYPVDVDGEGDINIGGTTPCAPEDENLLQMHTQVEFVARAVWCGGWRHDDSETCLPRYVQWYGPWRSRKTPPYLPFLVLCLRSDVGTCRGA